MEYTVNFLFMLFSSLFFSFDGFDLIGVLHVVVELKNNPEIDKSSHDIHETFPVIITQIDYGSSRSGDCTQSSSDQSRYE